MAKIELSAGIMSGLPQRIVYPGTASTSSNPSYQGALGAYPLLPYDFYDAFAVYGFINIYKGTVPTDFSTLTTPSSRNTDILVSYPSNGSNIFNLTVNATDNPAIINTSYVVASASGTATWFRLFTQQAGWFPGCYNQIIGTVGVTGSGSDLEIPSTSIVSGSPYRLQNLRLQFPSSWTY